MTRIRRRQGIGRRSLCGDSPTRPSLASIRFGVRCLLIGALTASVGCGSGPDEDRGDVARHVVELPGAERQIDFDDIVYSEELRRVLVPARQSGLYLANRDGKNATRVGATRTADSADAGRGLLFVLRRDDRAIDVVDPDSGRTVWTVATSAPGDYLRYVASTGELWVTQPSASPAGIELFTLPAGTAPKPRRAGFVEVPDGPEGITLNPTETTVYTHAGRDLAAIDVSTRAIKKRWQTGCDGTHGFPRVDKAEQFLIASCAHDGEVVLLDADDGRQLDRYAVGGGEALPGYSPKSDHFYVRGDPGTTLASLQASRDGFTLVHEVRVPETGHCLTADDAAQYWTCDGDRGRILRFTDQARAAD